MHFFQAFLFQLGIYHVPDSVLTEGYSNAFTELEKNQIEPLNASSESFQHFSDCSLRSGETANKINL